MGQAVMSLTVLLGEPPQRPLIRSKHAAGRDKDKLFLATHRKALQELLKRQ
jgi:hypothetical protein